jgi:hypothetical protein
LTNAFNSISRHHTLTIIHKEFPQLYPYLKSIYGTPTPIWLSVEGQSKQVLSQQGARQGEPLSSFFFGIGFQHAINETQRTLTRGHIFAYVDDVTIIAPIDEINKAISTFQSNSTTVNLSINPTKTKLLLSESNQHDNTINTLLPFSLPTENILHPYHPNIKRQGIDILGTPIGSTAFTNDWIQNKLASLTSEFSSIDAIPHLQSRWLLLWYCLRGKITYLYRALPPSITSNNPQSLTLGVNNLFLSSFSTILSTKADTTTSWLPQAKLPITSGGFGLGYQDDIATAAYLASTAIFLQSTIKHKELKKSYYPTYMTQVLKIADTFTRQFQHSFPTPPTIDDWLQNFKDVHPNQLQSTIADKMTTQRLSTIIKTQKSFNSLESPYIESLIDSPSGKFLQAIPFAPTTTFTNQQFLLSIRQRLQLPIDDIIPFIAHCPTCKIHIHTSSQHLHHLHTCRGHNHTHRHQHIVNCMVSMAKDASIPMILEPKKAFYTDKGNNLRPDFMSVTTFHNNSPYAFDVSVTHTVTSPTSQPHHASTIRSRSKTNKYKKECSYQYYQFTPLIFESSGYWTKDVTQYIKICATKASDRLHIPISTLIHRYTTQLSATLHRQTSNLLASLHNRQYKPISDTCIDQLAEDMTNQARIQ